VADIAGGWLRRVNWWASLGDRLRTRALDVIPTTRRGPSHQVAALFLLVRLARLATSRWTLACGVHVPRALLSEMSGLEHGWLLRRLTRCHAFS
jgi:hypothetical protein